MLVVMAREAICRTVQTLYVIVNASIHLNISALSITALQPQQLGTLHTPCLMITGRSDASGLSTRREHRHHLEVTANRAFSKELEVYLSVTTRHVKVLRKRASISYSAAE